MWQGARLIEISELRDAKLLESASSRNWVQEILIFFLGEQIRRKVWENVSPIVRTIRIRYYRNNSFIYAIGNPSIYHTVGINHNLVGTLTCLQYSGPVQLKSFIS
jgi:hypothetical protein